MIVRASVSIVVMAALAATSGCERTVPSVPPTVSGSTEELSGTLTIYAAASLAAAFEVIAEEFDEVHDQLDVRPLVVSGSTTLTTQLGEGAPADVLAVADESTMAAAVAAGTVDDDAVVFATNTLTVIVPLDNPGGIMALDDVADARVRVVLCAVELPCGTSSRRLLQGAGIEVSPASLEQNVSAVLTKVATGEADAGLVYRTDASASIAVTTIPTAGAERVVNRYSIATVSHSSNPEAARAFIAFVAGVRGQSILARYEFGAP